MRLLHIRQNNIKVIVSDYGSALRNLCLSSGIPCSCVYGETGEDSQIHLWDRVCVDGKWYYCDPAWNDGGKWGLMERFRKNISPGSDTCKSGNPRHTR